MGGLIEVEVANRFSRVRRLFGALERFLEFLFQQIRLVFLRLDGLTKDRLLPRIVVLHGTSSGLQVLERFWNGLGRVRDHSLGIAVDLEQGATAWTWNFELQQRLRHKGMVPQLATH